MDQLEQDSILPLASLVHYIQETFQFTTLISTLDHVLQLMDVTWKNVVKVPINWNTAPIIAQHIAYIRLLSQYDKRPTVFINESGFNLHVQKSKGCVIEDMYTPRDTSIPTQ